MSKRHRADKAKKKQKDSSDEESGDEGRTKKRHKKAKPAAPTQSSISVDRLPKADFSNLPRIAKNFWQGEPGEDPPSEALKQLRKSYGLNCKGALQFCPPPISDLSSLPPCFSEVMTYLGLSSPSIVQRQCWPAALNGVDILGIAPTGSGKTFAYTLPMIPHLQASTSGGVGGGGPRALVLVPTRELAIQVVAAMKPLRKLFNIRAVAIYGGEQREKQVEELEVALAGGGGGGLVVVSTPGRTLDLIATKQLTLQKVTYLVIDEADRMLAQGFYEQLNALASQIRPDRQTLLFSATFPGKLREAASQWATSSTGSCIIRCSTFEFSREEHDGNGKGDTSPSVPAASRKESEEEGAQKEGAETEEPTTTTSLSSSTSSSLTVSESITQHVHVCVPHKRPRLLIKFILRIREQEKQEKVRQAGPMLIFCTKIKTAGFVHGFLKSQSVSACEILHGKLPQTQREFVLNAFKAGKISCLVSTDVAARGLHIKNLRYVVNYDMPTSLEAYCHRIGRTGRQGVAGQAYSFFTRNLAGLAPDLLKLLERCNQIPEKNLVLLGQELEAGTLVLDEGEVLAGDGDGEGEE